MKNGLLILSVAFLLSCQNTGTKNKTDDGPAITRFEFQEEMHNFGELQAGEIVIGTFVFSNTGNKNLIVENIETDCGCIEAVKPKEPVKPGEKGLIEVKFDSSGLWGRQLKTITVQANTEKPKQLVIFADVKNEQLNIKN
jgi:hypothetical protein